MIKLNDSDSTLSRDQDAQLMLRLRDGDLSAYDQLVERFYGRVKATISYLMANDDWTEELTQEVFLRVFRARSNYEPISKFTTWLFTIVNNVVTSARQRRTYRRWTSFPMHGDNCSGNLSLVSDTPTPDECVLEIESREMIVRVLDRLSELQRTAVRLYYFEGQPLNSIATEMNTSSHAVKSLLHRARLRLSELLKPYEDEGRLPATVV